MNYKDILIKDKLFNLDKMRIMGIINLSPESFFSNEFNLTTKELLFKIENMLSAGADIIDIGAVSTKPNHKKINEIEEFNRINKILREVRHEFPEIIISLDSKNDKVIYQCIDLGIDIVNDVGGGNLIDETFEKISKNNIPYILTFNTDSESNSFKKSKTTNIFKNSMVFFSKKLNKIEALGVKDIILDPGFGFNKEIMENYELLKKLKDFQILNKPILVGVSRKSMIYKYLNQEASESKNGSTILHTMSCIRGANILRVHDIEESNELKSLLSLLQF